MKKVLCILLVAAMMSSVCACAAPAVKETSAEVKSPQEPDATEGQTTEAVTDYEYPEMTIILAHSGAATDARQDGALAIESILKKLPEERFK